MDEMQKINSVKHECLKLEEVGDIFVLTPEEQKNTLFYKLLSEAKDCPYCRRIIFQVFE